MNVSAILWYQEPLIWKKFHCTKGKMFTHAAVFIIDSFKLIDFYYSIIVDWMRHRVNLKMITLDVAMTCHMIYSYCTNTNMCAPVCTVYVLKHY